MKDKRTCSRYGTKAVHYLNARLDPGSGVGGREMLETALLDRQKETQMSNYYTDQTLHISDLVTVL